MRIAITGFVAGASCLQMQAALPDVRLIAPAIVLGAALLLIPRRLLRLAVAFCLGMLIGYAWAALLAQAVLAPALPKADEGRDLTLIGTIDNLPNRFSQGVRFNFAVERVLAPPGGVAAQVPPHVSLSWYSGFRDQVTEVGDVQPGERWQLTVRLQRPHGNEMWNAHNSIALSTAIRSTNPIFERTSEFATCSYFTYRESIC